jgi:hypothetical protein
MFIRTPGQTHQKPVQIGVPEGLFENSPGLQSWVRKLKFTSVPQGRLKVPDSVKVKCFCPAQLRLTHILEAASLASMKGWAHDLRFSLPTLSNITVILCAHVLGSSPLMPEVG